MPDIRQEAYTLRISRLERTLLYAILNREVQGRIKSGLVGDLTIDYGILRDKVNDLELDHEAGPQYVQPSEHASAPLDGRPAAGP